MIDAGESVARGSFLQKKCWTVRWVRLFSYPLNRNDPSHSLHRKGNATVTFVRENADPCSGADGNGFVTIRSSRPYSQPCHFAR
jgi:hypothetical protein